MATGILVKHRSMESWAAWLPLAIAPPAVIALRDRWPDWVFMWILTGTIFFCLKWLSWYRAPQRKHASRLRNAAYLFAWVGMNARAFLSDNVPVEPPRARSWAIALAEIALGAALLWIVAPRLPQHNGLLVGWTGMVGIALVLHFGTLQLLSLVWRTAGVAAEPIMRAPIKSQSLAEFWGRRWNTAFRDLAHTLVFRPLIRRLGAAGAALVAFLASGLVHDLVISVSARAGYGLPTLYFLIQAAGLFVEKSAWGQRLGLGRGLRGWLFTGFVTVTPAGLLFHRPFIENIVLPMMRVIGAW